MADVMGDIEAGEAAAVDVVDEGLVTELVARAQAGGMKLTGEGGLAASVLGLLEAREKRVREEIAGCGRRQSRCSPRSVERNA